MLSEARPGCLETDASGRWPGSSKEKDKPLCSTALGLEQRDPWAKGSTRMKFGFLTTAASLQNVLTSPYHFPECKVLAGSQKTTGISRE